MALKWRRIDLNGLDRGRYQYGTRNHFSDKTFDTLKINNKNRGYEILDNDRYAF